MDPNKVERKIGKVGLCNTYPGTYSAISVETLLGGDLFRAASVAFDTINDRVYFATHPAGATASSNLLFLNSARTGGASATLAPLFNNAGYSL